MALDQASQRTLVNSIELQVFELAYLLSLMKVESVAALPNAALFPKDPRVRTKALAEGQERLIRNGWITPAEADGTADYPGQLLSMAAAIASPAVSILTRREQRDGARTYATMYFNSVQIVEVVQTDRHAFRLTSLPQAPDAMHRVRKMVGVGPRAALGGAAVELRVEAFEQARRRVNEKDPSAAAELLIESGAHAEAAEAIVAALTAPERKGVVSVLRHAAQKVVDVRVLGFYCLGGAVWVTSVADEAARRVCIESVGADGFIGRLLERVTSMQNQRAG